MIAVISEALLLIYVRKPFVDSSGCNRMYALFLSYIATHELHILTLILNPYASFCALLPLLHTKLPTIQALEPLDLPNMAVFPLNTRFYSRFPKALRCGPIAKTQVFFY